MDSVAHFVCQLFQQLLYNCSSPHKHNHVSYYCTHTHWWNALFLADVWPSVIHLWLSPITAGCCFDDLHHRALRRGLWWQKCILQKSLLSSIAQSSSESTTAAIPFILHWYSLLGSRPKCSAFQALSSNRIYHDYHQSNAMSKLWPLIRAPPSFFTDYPFFLMSSVSKFWVVWHMYVSKLWTGLFPTFTSKT